MFPLPILAQLAGVLLSSAGQPGTGQPVSAQPTTNPNALALVLAALAAQRAEAQPPAGPPEPRGSGIVEGVVIATFLLAMFGTAALGIYMQSPITALAVLAFGMGVLASKFGTIVDFRFGSSWGSRQKDAWRPSGGHGAPIIVPAPQEPIDPETSPTPPKIPGVGPSTDPSTQGRRMDIPYDGATPASIRYNNPGAQYPSVEAARFGQIGYGVIGGGHKIARFPHAVNGAASNLDLLRRKYVGMTIGEAGKKWTGASSFGVPGYHDAVILTADMIDDPALAIPFMKAIARREAGRDGPLTEVEWTAAHEMFRAGSADDWLAGSADDGDAPVEEGPGGDLIVTLAKPHVGEEYRNVQVPKNDQNWKGPWDCAEFASWLVYQVTGRLYGCTDNNADPAKADAYTGAWKNDASKIGRMVSVSEAAGIPGAFLLRYPPAPGEMGHIAVSDGHGGTVEAASTKLGVAALKVSGRRWDTGVLPPGIAYSGAAISVSGPAKIYAVGQPNMDKTKVQEIQMALATKGFSPGEIDGEYGQNTALAVAAFQKANGIVADGEVGEVTAPLLGVTLG